MKTLYPSAVQFHCGLIAGASLIMGGFMLWLSDWWYGGVCGTIALVAVVASSVITVREG